MYERFLDGGELAVLSDALNSGYGLALELDGQQQAAIHRLAVDQDRARTAVPDVAAFFGAGQVQLVA